MNAEQARAIKPASQMDDTEIELQYIYSRILTASRTGLTSVNWGTQLSNEVVKKLIEDGYKVSQGFNEQQEFTCIIDWE